MQSLEVSDCCAASHRDKNWTWCELQLDVRWGRKKKLVLAFDPVQTWLACSYWIRSNGSLIFCKFKSCLSCLGRARTVLYTLLLDQNLKLWSVFFTRCKLAIEWWSKSLLFGEEEWRDCLTSLCWSQYLRFASRDASPHTVLIPVSCMSERWEIRLQITDVSPPLFISLP